jgi:hypothetical protein
MAISQKGFIECLTLLSSTPVKATVPRANRRLSARCESRDTHIIARLGAAPMGTILCPWWKAIQCNGRYVRPRCVQVRASIIRNPGSLLEQAHSVVLMKRDLIAAPILHEECLTFLVCGDSHLDGVVDDALHAHENPHALVTLSVTTTNPNIAAQSQWSRRRAKPTPDVWGASHEVHSTYYRSQ